MAAFIFYPSRKGLIFIPFDYRFRAQSYLQTMITPGILTCLTFPVLIFFFFNHNEFVFQQPTLIQNLMSFF